MPKGHRFQEVCSGALRKFLTNVAGDNVMIDNMKYFLREVKGIYVVQSNQAITPIPQI